MGKLRQTKRAMTHAGHDVRHINGNARYVRCIKCKLKLNKATYHEAADMLPKCTGDEATTHAR